MKTKSESNIPLDEDTIIKGIKEYNQKIKIINENRQKELDDLILKLIHIEKSIMDIDDTKVSSKNPCYFKTDIENYGVAQIKMSFSSICDNDAEESNDDIDHNTYRYTTEFDASVPKVTSGESFWDQLKYWWRNLGETVGTKDLFDIDIECQIKDDELISSEIRVYSRDHWNFKECDNQSFITFDGNAYYQYFNILQTIINTDIKEKVLRCKYKQSEMDYKRLIRE